MRAVCAQAWQAEAVEDGRLSGAERESFERHAATCADCRRERLVLAELRAAGERLPLTEPAGSLKATPRATLSTRPSRTRMTASSMGGFPVPSMSRAPVKTWRRDGLASGAGAAARSATSSDVNMRSGV